MSGDILHFTKSAHQRTLESLPWFLTQTLDPDERELVEWHLRGCPECRAELESQRRFREAYADSDIAVDPEQALAKLRPRLARTRSAPQAWRARWVDRILGAWRSRPAWTTLALTAQLGIILALGWALNRAEQAVPSYHTLASAGMPTRTQGDLIIVFDPGTQQRTVQAILRAAGARVVDGPLASGAYVLAVSPGSLAATLARLRAERGVALVEALRTEGTP